MATHSSVLAWRIPGMGEPGGLPSMGSHRVGYDWNDSAVAAVAQMLKNLLALQETPSLIPGSGRYPGEGIGYPLQCSWTSLVAQMVKNPPEIWETWVQTLGWEDSLEKERATCTSILAWRIPMGRGTWWAAVHGVSKSQTRLSEQARMLCVYVHSTF